MTQVKGFTGTHTLKVDTKGRVSVPAAFRRILAEADSTYTDGGSAKFFLAYGAHLKDRLEIYTVEEFARRIEQINGMAAGRNKTFMQEVLLSSSDEMEVDKDGRTILPKAHREKLGLDSGELLFKGMGDHIVVWAKDTYEATRGAKVAQMAAELGDDFDIMQLVGG
ncbi:division/cell wall cluster transcriptional repressor MraZ [Pelagovum pacificum]|uniref:division/cell wall cluster transcriptional repressor MraZ n=1 Tax=Pelagovum pacificum TaxID=2588711 RepID=UPI0022B16D28|nr:cell division/cell wall cluster transcriptional repressor MraZ [Pelagovum pacificum]